ncbi:hypothetical protein PTKIN_Ptkin18bG0052000 [Pterospermum kingtungense]
MAWNKPKMRLEGTKKSVCINGNDDPKCSKSVKKGEMKNCKARQADRIHDILCGRLVQDKLVFQQELMVRSFDIGSDGKMSIVALANCLQETLLSHSRSIGLLGDGFSTPEMSKRDLVWVYSNSNITVDRYPSW